jgi:acyl carrier protein
MEPRILQGIQEVARLHLGITVPLEPETDLYEVLRLDSIRLLTLVAELENRFQIILEEGDEVELKTVEDLVQLLQKRGA